MVSNTQIVEDMIIKRIIKCYLLSKKKATSRMIAKYIENENFGLKKKYTSAGIGNKMKVWIKQDYTWFNIDSYKEGKHTWYYVKK